MLRSFSISSGVSLPGAILFTYEESEHGSEQCNASRNIASVYEYESANTNKTARKKSKIVH
jgi:hypothetical protein